MTNPYRRAMDHIRLSPQAREDIAAAMERPLPRRQRRSLGQPAVLAAVLAVVLSVTAAATALQLVFFHPVPEDVAETLQPVGRSAASEGVTLTVQSASIAGGKFRAYVTIKDEEGGRLSKEGFDIPVFELSAYTDGRTCPVSVFDSINFPGNVNPVIETGPISYDEASGTYGFLLELQDKDGKPITFPSQHFLLEVYGMYTGHKDGEVSITLDWPDAAAEAETAHVSKFRHFEEWDDSFFDIPLSAYSRPEGSRIRFDDGADLLAPGETEIQVAENRDISAIGWVDGKLHVQERISGRKSRSDQAWWYTAPLGMRTFLTQPDGSRMEPELIFDFFTEDDLICYYESVFDITPEELAGCVFTAVTSPSEDFVDGIWSVEFSLDEAATE